MATPKSRSRRPKAETETEFEKIKEEIEQQKLDLNPKTAELSKLKEIEVRETIKDVTAEAVVQRIGSLGLEISRALTDLSARLLAETNLLQSLKEAVAQEQAELKRLHQLDVAATSLDLLVEEHSQKKASLEKEIEETQSQWTEEQIQKEREQKEFDENLKKQRAREKEEYEYQKALDRKKEQDSFEEALKAQERKNKEKQETLEKSWAHRESLLKEREEEFSRLKKENIEFPERLKKEIDKAVVEATKALEAKHKQDLLLSHKEIETERKLAELKAKSLEETATRQFTQIESLQTRLEEAKKQVQDIAIKAIESTSGARALSHVNQIAMEQAKTRGAPQG